MQKVIQRTATARKQAQKKLFRAKRQNDLVDRKDTIRVRKDYNRAMIDNIKGAREARWEDWQKGDLAPKRDAGPAAKIYGSLDSMLLHPPKIPKHLRRKHILFAPGDRVVVIRGRDRGKINEITQVNEESETVVIKDINQADINVPQWAKASMNIKADVLAQSMPVPMDDVRLVIAMTTPGSHTTRDHIVQHAHAAGPYLERPSWSKLPRYTRYVSGIDVAIPWPSETEPEHKDGEWDTLRMHVDDATWIPSLDNAPFPSTVLDELRNKYSRFRARHDPEYVREKVMEEYRQEYLASRSALTPVGEYHEVMTTKNIEARQARTAPDGTLEMDQATRDFINNFMEKRQAPEGGKSEESAAA
ncbi:hypothetical protein N7492_004825 [Penicillium capsulatum]|uniref:KOW domain-containing protein n=1 Tax=Penicillium capsulatum TaxID=69766 RepID=A0A9W9IEL5_9EURO|nr:hypothetical protein N7492_004825 [Penicillium capsulatum]